MSTITKLRTFAKNWLEKIAFASLIFGAIIAAITVTVLLMWPMLLGAYLEANVLPWEVFMNPDVNPGLTWHWSVATVIWGVGSATGVVAWYETFRENP